MDRTHKTLDQIMSDLESKSLPSFDELVEKGLIKVVVVDSPCDKCHYEWFNMKDNSSCHDECREYQAYLVRPDKERTIADVCGPKIEAQP